LLLLTSSALCLAGCGSENTETGDSQEDSSKPEDPAPNVLFVIADDMGLEAHPCYSMDAEHEQATMPNIEALCERGVVFDEVWANPLCSPTRASLMTGRYPHQHGVGTAATDEGPGLALTEWTLPMALKADTDKERALANIGKWHLVSDENGGFDSPNLLGWEHYEGMLSGTLESYFSYNEVVNGVGQQVENYATTENVDDALRWVGDQDQPWLLWLAFNAPHLPHHLPPEHLHGYLSLSGEEEDIADRPLPYFLAMLQAMDTEIGRLFEGLGEEVLANTEIIFLGDNGTFNRVNQRAYPDEHGKGSLYQGGIHVPLVISGPSVQEGGRRSDTLVSVNDLFATLLELAGTPWTENLPESWDGDSYSLLPLLQSAEESSSGREWVMAELFGEKIQENTGRALRIGDYKLIQFAGNQKAFFNLAEDPFETSNILGQPLSTEAEAAYNALLAISEDWPTTILDPPDPE